MVDASTGAYATVDRISGGSPDLRPASQHETRARISLNKAIGKSNFSINLDYSTDSIANPIIVTGYVSKQFQIAFPGRFGRNANGELISIDIRPFNAQSERRDSLRPSLHFSGHAGSMAVDPSALGNDSGADWDLSITDEWTLQHFLHPSAGREIIDLLAMPIDGVQGTPRHRVNVEASVSRRKVNLQLSGQWRSGSRVADLSSQVGNFTHFSPFWTISGKVAWTLPRLNSMASLAKPIRLSVEVENLLNQRLTVRDEVGRTPIAYQPVFLDPIGRVIMARVSRNF